MDCSRLKVPDHAALVTRLLGRKEVAFTLRLAWLYRHSCLGLFRFGPTDRSARRLRWSFRVIRRLLGAEIEKAPEAFAAEAHVSLGKRMPTACRNPTTPYLGLQALFSLYLVSSPNPPPGKFPAESHLPAG